MTRWTTRMLALAAFVAVAVTAGLGIATAAAGPVTTLSADPAFPNGTPPWYVSAPEIWATSDSTGKLYYRWSTGTTKTANVTAGIPFSLGLAPEGAAFVRAFTVSGGVTETPAAERVTYTDSVSPSRPADLAGTLDGAVTLTWTGSTDAVSGVTGYYVYRNDDGVLYDSGDRIGFVTGLSAVDSADTGGDLPWYAVSARDAAGNESFLTDSVRLGLPARLGGASRYDTSVLISEAGFADSSVATVVVASGSDFPDALCAAGLAGALGSPVLLVGEGPLPASLTAELARLGATDAYVIGGQAAVGADTIASLRSSLSGTVTRLWGPTRNDTARRVATEIRAVAGPTPRAYLVSGIDFPDALSAAAAAYAEPAPILFATPTGLPGASATSLAEGGVGSTVIVGGTVAVWDGVDAVVPSAERVRGANRFATSRAFADWAASDGVLGGTALVVATGLDFPDGLAAGPLAGSDAGPVVLTSSADVSALAAWLDADPLRFESAHLVGGTAALADAVRSAVGSSLTIE